MLSVLEMILPTHVDVRESRKWFLYGEGLCWGWTAPATALGVNLWLHEV